MKRTIDLVKKLLSLAGNLSRLVRFAVCAAVALVLAACAHPISIQANKLPERSAQTSPKKVAYVMTDADRQKQVTTEGGSGDKITYYPYKEFERALRAALASIYSDVTVVSSATNAIAIRETGASFVFLPEISTTSSSPSLFTWAPTKFSVTVSVDVLDPQGVPLARLRVTGNGEAEWEEFKGEFGLAGRRAVENAAQMLVEEILHSEKLR
jgi:hypothetical protein